MTTSVGILIYPGVEPMDFCGPFEVFTSARLDEESRRQTDSPFTTHILGETGGPVVTTGGMTLLPRHAFKEAPPLDLLVVPGGIGSREAMKRKELTSAIANYADEGTMVASVCTGSLLLGAAGLLDGKRATTHRSAFSLMEDLFPSVTIDRKARWVDEGKTLTSGGISAGVDLSLHIVSRIYGEEIGRATAHHIEYPYPESSQVSL